MKLDLGQENHNTRKDPGWDHERIDGNVGISGQGEVPTPKDAKKKFPREEGNAGTITMCKCF